MNNGESSILFKAPNNQIQFCYSNDILDIL